MGGAQDLVGWDVSELKLGEAERRILAELAKTGKTPVTQED
ncbi:hypothetical protein [Kibdelosporangium philippinense]|nr:hypothetical protein [Kibdelosporangium philippinense]